MQQAIKLSDLAAEIQLTFEERFEGETFWIEAETSDVKKYTTNRRCYLKLVEKEGRNTVAEMRAVFWANTYTQIEHFEKHTRQVFKDGITITCLVRVRFHPQYGLNLDVLQIDVAYTLGTIELKRQKTLEQLVKENPHSIRLEDGVYRTYNNQLPIPMVVQKIALITAPNSDGQRDFLQELETNQHGFSFYITQFLTQIQGDNAHEMILAQLELIEQQNESFDLIAIVRGGGSQTDFKPFEDYDLAKMIAEFPIPIFTGIGHDRNTSIADLMAREHKTPTKVAAVIIENNFQFENRIINIKVWLEKKTSQLLDRANHRLDAMKRLVRASSPEAILRKGFAMVTVNDTIATNAKSIAAGTEIKTRFADGSIYSKVTKKEIHDN
ncbi:MAG: exodeoxyribonuclease VII large subunit [Chitinophagaceae bacterium]